MRSAALTFLIALVGSVYLWGWFHQRSIATWRVCSFFLGFFATWVAVASSVVFGDRNMLTAHMIQHSLVMTIAPPLIWLGEPIMIVGSTRWRFPTVLGNVLGNPVFCWLAATATLILWHVPPIFQLGMQSATWHFIQHVSFFIAGLLFWWPVIQPWPSVARWPRWSILLYLFLATLPCDVLSGFLVFSDRVAYPMYHSMHRMGGLTPLEDQQCAAALMWTVVTVVFLVAGAVFSIQLLSPKLRLQGIDKLRLQGVDSL